jgi:NADH dehydrogenase
VTAARKRIVIIGGGFGGITAARRLRRVDADVTLVDRSNHHTFQPLLYQVATAGLSAPQIASPIRHMLREQRNCRVIMGDVAAIDSASHVVQLKPTDDLGHALTLPYDYLIVAAGVTHAYFGHENWAAHAPGLKTMDDALNIRRRILLAFERAERETDPAAREAALTFVVIGGGPTGVELAGTLAEIARHTLAREFRAIDPATARILLVEAGERVLSSYSPRLSAKAQVQLEKLGVTVRARAPVTDIDATGVRLSDQHIASDTVLWAAGVQASPLGACLPAERDRAGRVIVQSALNLASHPEVFVIGDLARVPWHADEIVPGVANAAEQMGAHAAECVRRLIAGEPAARLPAFRYRHLGSLATIGRKSAIAVFFGKLELSGLIAWWAWVFIHILFLIDFRNRVIVMLDWAWSYWTYQRHARLIFDPDKR